MIDLFLREAGEAIGSTKECLIYTIEEHAVSLLCEFDYPGNIRALRNLIFELTSYLTENEVISTQLVQFALTRLNSHGGNFVSALSNSNLLSIERDCIPSTSTPSPDQESLQSLLTSIANEGDIILPLEVCVLRRDETFKQWTARAKHCSIEAARQATGGSMRTAAARLGLTRNSLLGHFHRTRQVQNQSLFDLEGHSD